MARPSGGDGDIDRYVMRSDPSTRARLLCRKVEERTKLSQQALG